MFHKTCLSLCRFIILHDIGFFLVIIALLTFIILCRQQAHWPLALQSSTTNDFHRTQICCTKFSNCVRQQLYKQLCQRTVKFVDRNQKQLFWRTTRGRGQNWGGWMRMTFFIQNRSQIGVPVSLRKKFGI